MRTMMFAAALAVLATYTLSAIADPAAPRLRVLGTHESGLFNVGGAEIPTYDPLTRRAFVVNAGSATVNEGEPDATYTNDPEGSVTIIDLLSF